MRRTIGITAALFAMLAFPAAALAHHAEGTATCTEATVNLIGFGWQDKADGVDITVKIDGKTVATRHVTPNDFPGSNLTVHVPYSKPQDMKAHTVQVYVHWKTSSGYFARTVSGCTPPPPPPPPCTTTGTCKPPPPPPCTVNCGPPPPCSVNCTPPPPPCTPTATTKCNDIKHYRCPPDSKYSITVRPRNAQHGLVHFRLNGPYVKKARWYVDMHRRGVQGERFERTNGKGGRVYSVWLWAKPVWGSQLWGFHWVTVRARVGNGHGRKCQIHQRLHYFNNDPPLS